LAVIAFALVLVGCAGSAAPASPTADIVPAVSRISEVAGESLADQTALPVSPATAQQAAPESPQPRPRVIVLDPGHGGPEIGPVSVQRGHYLSEKDSNLDFAHRLRSLLVDAGFEVILTRDGDVRSTGEATGPTQFPYTRFDLQRRIDIANEARADLFLSLHSNGSPSAGESGVEVWWEPNRPWGADNKRFAQSLQRHVVDNLAAWGYRARDRGIKDNSVWRFTRGRYIGIYVIAPPREENREDVIRRGGVPEDVGFAPGAERNSTRALNMPSALIENLFITNETDAAILRDNGARDAITRGMRDAIVEYFQSQQ
jgi:N-acetylmuramoyl-L-alanine amidase